MPLKKKYISYMCKDCEIDFFIKASKRKTVFCPSCGDDIYIEKIGSFWTERGFNYKRPWTVDDDELLLLCDRQGYTRKQIADELGRSRQAVNNRYCQLEKKG